MVHLARAAERRGDVLLGAIFASLHEDCAWHREVAQALSNHAIRARSENRAVLEGWVAAWTPLAMRAAQELAPFMGAAGAGDALRAFHREWLAGVGLEIQP
jgi:hypothetical protein